MQKLQSLLKFLVESPIEFVLVGGFAAVLHGCNQTTRDIDICVLLNPEEIISLRSVLAPLHPKLRTSPHKPSFLTSPTDLNGVKSLYLETDLGVLDVISNVEAVGEFFDVLKNSEEIALYGGTCRVISIDDLIRNKKALGRHRDLAVVEELEVIRKEIS